MIKKLKYWLFHSKFMDDVRRDYYQIVFSHARDDVRETHREDIDEAAERRTKETMLSLLSPINWEEVVTIDKTNKMVYIGGAKADVGRLANLKSEAEFFAASELWKLISETPKSLAHKKMFVDSISLDDLKNGKTILYTLDSQKNIIDIFRSFTPKQ